MELKLILESILFSAQKPLSSKELRALLKAAVEQDDAEEAAAWKSVKEDALNVALEALRADHQQAERSYELACVAGAWQFVAKPEYAPWIKALVGQKPKPPRLSQPALETLAIIAYRQPVTRSEVEQVRGVSVDGVMQTLLERGLVEQRGRAEVVGRPMTYGTSALFLEYFGLASLDELPGGDELRRIPVERPPDLMTTDPELETVASDQMTLAEAVSETAAEPASPGDSASADTPDQPQPPSS